MIKVLIIQLLTKPGVKYKNINECEKGKWMAILSAEINLCYKCALAASVIGSRHK